MVIVIGGLPVMRLAVVVFTLRNVAGQVIRGRYGGDGTVAHALGVRWRVIVAGCAVCARASTRVRSGAVRGGGEQACQA